MEEEEEKNIMQTQNLLQAGNIHLIYQSTDVDICLSSWSVEMKLFVPITGLSLPVSLLIFFSELIARQKFYCCLLEVNADMTNASTDPTCELSASC